LAGVTQFETDEISSPIRIGFVAAEGEARRKYSAMDLLLRENAAVGFERSQED
jgi:hypothetical protein